MFTVIEIQDNRESVGVLSHAYNTEQEAQQKYYEILFYASASSVPLHSAIMFGEGCVYKSDTINHGAEDTNVIIEDE